MRNVCPVLCKGLMILCQPVIRGYKKRFTNRYADVESEARLIICRMLASDTDYQNLPGAVLMGVKEGIKLFLMHDQIIRVPHDVTSENIRESVKVQYNGEEEHAVAGKEYPFALEEILEDLRPTDSEMILIGLLYRGYTMEEIAPKMGFKDHKNVEYHIKKLRDRLTRLGHVIRHHVTSETFTCAKCGEKKTKDQFYTQKDKVITSACKVCWKKNYSKTKITEEEVSNG